MAFPDEVLSAAGKLDARIEWAPGADLSAPPSTWTWTDISADVPEVAKPLLTEDGLIVLTESGEEVLLEDLFFGFPARLLNQTITVERGRQDEASATAPTTTSVQLDNPDGHLTPNNPQSPWWPYLNGGAQPRVPMRLSLPNPNPETGTWLDGPAAPDTAANGVSTPDSVGLSITGDLWVAADVTVRPDIDNTGATWPGSMVLVAKVVSLSQISYLVYFDPFRAEMNVQWSTDGTAGTLNTVSVPIAPLGAGRHIIGLHLDVDNGTGGHDVEVYSAPSWGGSWTLIGSVTNSGTTSIFDSTSLVEIGYSSLAGNPFQGRIHRVEVRSGDSSGTVVADPDFTVQTAGAASFADNAGNTWTIEGDARLVEDDGRVYRFLGTIGGNTLAWPHGDISALDPYYPGVAHVDFDAAGILRRLGQGRKQLRSPLRRAVETLEVASIGSQPFEWVGYWPFEVTSGAADVLGGNPEASLVGVDFNASPFPGSDTCAQTAAGTLRKGFRVDTAGAIPAGADDVWLAVMWVRVDELPTGSDQLELLRATLSGNPSQTFVRLYLAVHSGEVRLHAEEGNNTSSSVASTASRAFPAEEWVRIWMWQSPTSGIVAWQQVSNPTIFDNAGTVITAGKTRVESLSRNGRAISTDGNLQFGHLVLGYADDIPPGNITEWAEPERGYAGETASDRFLRLCTEQGVPVTRYLGITPSTPMGPQSVATFSTLLDECTVADQALLIERTDALGLTFRPAGALYNQTPALSLDAAASEITNPYLSVNDDQRLRNEVTAQRFGGSSFTATTNPPPDPNDVYDESVTVNVANDAQLPEHAGWRLHMGTWPENRSPQVTVDLAVAPDLIATVCAIREGDVIRITNLPSQHPLGPNINLMVQGWSETIDPDNWSITFDCTPGGIWTVGILEDDTLGRLDTAGSELGADVAETDTTLTLTTTRGPRWIDSATYSAEFPFDLLVGGERMTVTAITGTSSPQTATVTRSVNGVIKSHAAGAEVRLADPLVLAL